MHETSPFASPLVTDKSSEHFCLHRNDSKYIPTGLKAYIKKSLMLARIRKQYENMPLSLYAHTIYHVTNEYTLYASPHHDIACSFHVALC